jgi:hypothetical protein
VRLQSAGGLGRLPRAQETILSCHAVLTFQYSQCKQSGSEVHPTDSWIRTSFLSPGLLLVLLEPLRRLNWIEANLSRCGNATEDAFNRGVEDIVGIVEDCRGEGAGWAAVGRPAWWCLISVCRPGALGRGRRWPGYDTLLFPILLLVQSVVYILTSSAQGVKDSVHL